MNELDKMRSEQLYDFDAPEIVASWRLSRRLCAQLQTRTVHYDNYREVMEDLIPYFSKIISNHAAFPLRPWQQYHHKRTLFHQLQLHHA